MISISTVTPVFMGEKYLALLVDKLELFRLTLASKYKELKLIECIFVIDGAKDNSLNILNGLAKTRNWIRIIELSKNYGQHPATIAGILHTSGDWVVTLDEDLQHNPDDIPLFFKELLSNKADVCYASAVEKTHNSLIRDNLALLFKGLVARISGIPHIKIFNSFRLVRGSIARASAAICGHETYYDIALSWFTDRVTNVKVSLVDNRNQKQQGKSGYSFISLLGHGRRMLMTSKIKLLRVGLLIGISAFCLSIVLAIYALYTKFYGISSVFTQGWYSTILVILFFSGLTSLFTGFILESISDILLDSKGKPPFFVVDRSSDDLIRAIILNK